MTKYALSTPRQVPPELSELPELSDGGPLWRQCKDLNRFLAAREKPIEPSVRRTGPHLVKRRKEFQL